MKNELKKKHLNFFAMIVIVVAPLLNLVFDNNKVVGVSILFGCGIVMSVGTIIIASKSEFTLRKKIEVGLYIISTFGLVFLFVLEKYKIYVYIYSFVIVAALILAIFSRTMDSKKK